MKQQVIYTPDEYEQVRAAMAAASIEKHTDFAIVINHSVRLRAVFARYGEHYASAK